MKRTRAHKTGRTGGGPMGPAVFEPMEPRLLLDGTPVITEFLAWNTVPWYPQDPSSTWDWIEIHNPTTDPIPLTGWYLTDDPGTPTQWPFPTGTVLQPGEYKIVFASSLENGDPAHPADLHADFGLSKGGEYLALVDPGENPVSWYDFPAQTENVSYGLYEDLTVTPLVPANTAARTLIPTGEVSGWTGTTFDDSGWIQGADKLTGIGYETTVPGLGVTLYESRVTISSLNTAKSVITTPSQQGAVFRQNVDYINLYNTGGHGRSAVDELTFPGLVKDVNKDNFVIDARGQITIPTAGPWTFVVNSDDGFSLQIGSITDFYMDYPNLRSAADTVGVFNVTTPGTYDLRLIMFEATSGASVELWAAQGTFASWNATDFHLVGDTAGGGLYVESDVIGSGIDGTGYGNLIKTDVETAMLGQNTSAYIRIPFNVADPGAYDTLFLRMKYDDGFVAYLNGEEVARINTPGGTPAWNAAATDTHTNAAARQWVDVNITDHLNLVTAGTNVLAIHGLNEASDLRDFLILPELADIEETGLTPHFFSTPSPGDPNQGAFIAYVKDTKFDNDRGFYDAPFAVTITSNTVGATIYYTKNGSSPLAADGSVSPTAIQYVGPVSITTTTCLRAVATREGYMPSNVDTQTYVFLNDVIHQTTAPAGFPTSWGGTAADYQMDPDVVNNPLYSATIIDDLKSIPTMSLVMDVNDLFGTQGIYSNPNSEGTAWERAGSIEMFYPEGYPVPDDGFQVNCGVRMYGGVGRYPEFKKHAFRLLFKGDYGPTKLDYALFGPDAADEFDTIILRHNFNDGYVWNPAYAQYIRDAYVRNLQLALGQPSSHSSFVHLYVNGLYWGLYDTSERPDQAFGATYFGGDKENWDAVNAGEPTGESDMTEWNAMLDLCRQGLVSAENYQRLQGNNPDGTNNPAYPNYLDVENYIVYMLVNFWAGNTDWPGHNWYASRQEDPGSTGYKVFSWDAEWVIGLNSGVGANQTGASGSIAEPYAYLRQNAEFKVLFGDIAHQAFFNGGPLYVDSAHPDWDPTYPERNQPAGLYASMADFIERAIVGESARWGDVASGTPYTLANWQSERDWILDSYMPFRSANVLQQLKNAGLYPTVTATTFSINGAYQYGGTVSRGSLLTMSVPTGTVYYTLDGSDPRLVGGGLSPTALVYNPQSPVTIDNSVLVKARIKVGSDWSALNEATYLLDTAPPLRITEIMYNPPAPTQAEIDALPPALQPVVTNEYFEYLELRNTGTETLNLTGMRIYGGVDFTFPSMTLVPGAYVLVVRNQSAFQVRYGTGFTIAGEFQNGTGLSNAGEDLFLDGPVGDQIHAFDYEDDWYPVTDGGGFSLVVRDASQAIDLWDSKDGWRASWQAKGNPGAADAGYDPGSIVINEIVAHSNYDPQDWIELCNTTGGAINITGWFLSDDPMDLTKYKIGQAGQVILTSGGYEAFTELDNFGLLATDPGKNVWFALSELGEGVFLTSCAADGSPGGYREDEFFGASDPDVSFGRYEKPSGGKDFVAMASQTFEAANALPLIPAVVINEVMYNPAGTGCEWIELYNRTGADFPLHDAQDPVNSWMFTDGIEFTFPADAYVPAHGYALVVSIDPAAFVSQYGIPPTVNVYGPWTGALADEGERIELSKPGNPEPGGFVPYIQTEKITYNDRDPWPRRPDGGGSALSRISPDVYGNDPSNWMSSAEGGTPGALNVGVDDTPPTVPTNLAATLLGPAEIQLTWTPSTDPQSGVANYRVYRDNLLIAEPETAAYTDTDIGAAWTYSYQVSAVNADGIESDRSTPALQVRILGVVSVNTPNQTTVSVVFSEPVTKTSAENINHYTVTYNGGTQEIDVIGAVLQADARTAILTLQTPLEGETTYTLAITDVVTGSGLAIVPNCQVEFIFYVQGSGTILREYWLNVGGTSVSDLTGNVNYPNNPSGRDEMTRFEVPVNWSTNYGTRMRGYIHPPLTGDYVFRIASDDNSELWLSTDEDPAHKVLICRVNGYTGSRDWFNAGHPEQVSVPIHLVAGQRYYIEAIQKEGGGDDNLSVGWRLPDAAQTFEGPIPGLRLSPYLVAPPEVTVSIEANDPSAGEQGSNPGQFTVTRTGSTSSDLTVRYTVSGTAVSADYTPVLSGQVVIPSGAASATITMTPVDDALTEPNETVILTLSTSGDYLIGTGSATVTIVDNDGVADCTVSIVASDPSSGESPTDTGRFTITRSGNTANLITVYYTVSGTAGAGDYTPVLTGQIDMRAGLDLVTITITPVNDAEAEPDETVILTLSPHATYLVGAANSATVTILDDDRPPPSATVQIMASDAAAAEALADKGMFMFYRAGDISGNLTVYYSVSGTASAADYLPGLTGSIVIPAGQMAVLLEIMPVDDAYTESTESVVITLLDGPGYARGAAKMAVVNITDNDTPPPTMIVSVVAADPNAAEEGQDTGRFTFSRVGSTAAALTVYYTMSGTASAADYTPTLSGQVVIPAGAASVPVVITPVDDIDEEADETLILTITAKTNYAIGSILATVTIADNDAAPTPSTIDLVATDPDAAEQGQNGGQFTITRTGGSIDTDLTVYYTIGGTASSGDYTPLLTGQVVIPADQESVVIDITPVDDEDEEEFAETLTLTLSADASYVLGENTQAAVTILDDDRVVSVVATDPDAAETGPDPGQFTLSRTGSTAHALTVYYMVGGSAGSDDYTPELPGEIVIPEGESSVLIDITPIDDGDQEPNVTIIFMILPNPVYRIGSASATITILDNDRTVSIEAIDPHAAESGTDPGQFIVTRTGAVVDPLTVRYTIGGTAGTGDYTPVLTGEVVIPADEEWAFIDITPVDDEDQEANETLILTLSTDPAYVIGTAEAVVTIVDNDRVVQITATDPTGSEQGQGPAQFTVTRSGSTADDLMVYYLVGGTAGEADYTPVLSGQVVIPAGAASATIDITPVDDPDVEDPETVIVLLASDVSYVVGPDSHATVTILDNDGVQLPEVEVAATDATAAEKGANPGEFTVTRTGNLVGALTVYYTLGGTAGAVDYTPALTGQVVIPDASDSAVITITPVDDGDQEPDETLVLTLTPHASYTVGAGDEATVTILDNELPVVTAVVLNPDPLRTVRTVSQIEPSGIGVDTIRVTFSEAVTFTSANVVAEKVFVDESGNVSVTSTLSPTVGGSGTTQMSIQFANAWQNVIDTWVRIRLTGGVIDTDGHALDGEPRLDSSNLGYIYKATDDLPTGDGTAGGDAVFYVGSLRADMRGFGPFQPNPNGIVDQWDLNGFTSKYTQGNLDADFRGFGPFQPAPNGIVDQWDINGFTSAYTSALTQGKRLWPLPVVPEGMAPGGVPGSGELLSAPLASGDPVAVFAPETSLVAADAAAAASGAVALSVVGAGQASLPAAPDLLLSSDDLTGDSVIGSDAPFVPASPIWSPMAAEAVPADSALVPDDGLVDLLALPALEVSLGT